MDFERDSDDEDFMISDIELFCRDIRIRMYDACMIKLTRGSGTTYTPIAAPTEPADGTYLDRLPASIEADLEKIVSMVEMQMECKTHLKPINDTFVVNEEAYNKLLDSVHGLIIGRMMHKLCKDGILEMCCDDGKIIYRQTPKGRLLYDSNKSKITDSK